MFMGVSLCTGPKEWKGVVDCNGGWGVGCSQYMAGEYTVKSFLLKLAVEKLGSTVTKCYSCFTSRVTCFSEIFHTFSVFSKF